MRDRGGKGGRGWVERPSAEPRASKTLGAVQRRSTPTSSRILGLQSTLGNRGVRTWIDSLKTDSTDSAEGERMRERSGKVGSRTMVDAANEAAQPVPGRQSLVQQSIAPAPADAPATRAVPAGPPSPTAELPRYASIQRIFGGPQARAAAPDVHAAAAQGISGPAGQLPHLERIQKSFGKHDVSHVQAHTGSEAKAGSQAMGAEAFATGDHVAFAGAPSLHIAAHEAAHVVQQKGGVQLAGGVGKTGDAYEQHADQVADLVVQGKSAEALLDQHAGGGDGASVQRAVQRFDSVKEHKAAGDDGSGGLEYIWNGAHVGEASDRLPTSRKHPQDCQVAMDAHGNVANPPEFRLTHGDIVMLSGDLFDPREVDEHGAPVTDSLFKVAAKPSSDPGRQVGTQDEIIYAIYRENPGDIRFSNQCTKEQPAGGMWALYPRRFATAVIETVESRYLRLAAKNRDHFARPDEKQKGIGGSRDSGQGAYRALHEDALYRAYQAGVRKEDSTEALAREAAAEHFLTDAFSAGPASRCCPFRTTG